MNEAEFVAWVANAEVGDRCVYNRREYFSLLNNRSLMQAAWNFYNDGKVMLFQRRNQNIFEYIAIRITPAIANAINQYAIAEWYGGAKGRSL